MAGGFGNKILTLGLSGAASCRSGLPRRATIPHCFNPLRLRPFSAAPPGAVVVSNSMNDDGAEPFAWWDSTRSALLVRLAGPLGPLGPGTYPQSALPGMPADHRIAARNSTGLILAVRNTPLLRYRVVAGGVSAPLSQLTTLPEPGNGSYGSPGLNENGMLLVTPAGAGASGTHLLVPTLDCSVELSGVQPYRIGEEFDLDVVVENLTGNSVANLRLEGDTPGSPGLAAGAFPSFDIIGGPTPATPLSLAGGTTTTIRYRCRATRSGIGEVRPPCWRPARVSTCASNSARPWARWVARNSPRA
jgi:hypothetical protein